MSDRRTTEPTLERWFTERARRLAEPRAGFEEMLKTAAETPQQRYRWLPAELSPTQLRVSAAALASLVVAVVAFGLLTTVMPATSDVEPLDPVADALAPAAVQTGDALSGFESVASAGLQVESKSAGIVLVERDGANHAFRETTGLALGPDGRGWASQEDRVIEIGVSGAHGADDGVPRDVWGIWTGADGQPFLRARDGISSSDGSRWALVERADVAAASGVGAWGGPSSIFWQPATTTTDGDVWAISVDGLVQQTGDTWATHDPESMGVDWPGDLVLDEYRSVNVVGAADGSVWAEIQLLWSGNSDDPDAWRRSDGSMLVRYEGGAWELASPDEWLELDSAGSWRVPVVQALIPLSDGSMWVPFSYVEGRSQDAHVAHWDGSDWSVSVAPSNAEAVTADESGFVWFLNRGADRSERRLYRFDGQEWESQAVRVGGDEVTHRTLQAAPDGTLWLHEFVYGGRSRLFVLDPAELGFEGGA